MEQRRLGRTGLSVGVLGVGGHTYPVGDGPDDFCTPAQRAALIGTLVDSGVSYFDTTWFNEVELLADSLRRAAITVPLQVSLQYVDGISDPRWRRLLRSELESRLEVMGYSQAPLFIMGVGNGAPPRSEIAAACEAMQALKEEGLIQSIGLSCHELGAFDRIADVIEESDLIDYLMLRYNWKYPQAAERLLPLAQQHDIGLVAMKVFCWDCGPDNWGRRISVFEPAAPQRKPASTGGDLNAAQRSLLWCLNSAPFATSVPSINAPWEAEQLLEAVRQASPPFAGLTAQFGSYQDRLYDPAALAQLAVGAESLIIRERAAALQGQL